MESIIITQVFDYQLVHNLATEARQKLEAIRPTSLGQASRISGVNPADIAILSVMLKKQEQRKINV